MTMKVLGDILTEMGVQRYISSIGYFAVYSFYSVFSGDSGLLDAV